MCLSYPIKTANIETDNFLDGVHNPKEEARSCQRFVVDSEPEGARHKVFIYAIENVKATTVDKKFDNFFINSSCGATLNLAVGLGSNKKTNREDAGLKIFYAHEKKNLPDRPKLEFIEDDLIRLQD